MMKWLTKEIQKSYKKEWDLHDRLIYWDIIKTEGWYYE